MWLLAQIRPNADEIAKRNLLRQGFRTFQPMEMRTIVRRGRYTQQLRPFFSGYIFVMHPSISAPWSVVNSTYGVSRLVRFGDRHVPVPEPVMADLFAACDENNVISIERPFAVGDTVKVLHGPFTDFVGEVERLHPDQRAIILLDIMGKQTRVTMSKAGLRAASGRAKQSG